jgi:hypothetical protein
MCESLPPLKNYDQAAAWLKVSKRWLEAQVAQGAPHVRLGKYVRFSQANLDAIVKAGEPRPLPGAAMPARRLTVVGRKAPADRS